MGPAFTVFLAAANAGRGSVDSISWFLLSFNAELLGVLGFQSLPTVELHHAGADHASDRLTREEPVQNVEAEVPAGGAPRDVAPIDVVPEGEARAATERLE